MKIVAPKTNQKLSSLAMLTLLTAGLNVVSSTTAKAMPEIQLNSDGSIEIDRNAIDLRTGTLENDSNIPLPNGLINNPQEGQAQPVIEDRWAPNSIEVHADIENINTQLNEAAPGFSIQEESLQLNTQFNLQHRLNNHAFGEGIQVTVYGPDGTEKNSQTAFIRGDRVTIGPDGNALPSSDQITVNYGASDIVELRVLTLRRDNSQPEQSGIYFTSDGEFAVEDQQNGGDRDFTDGDYFELSNGDGQADVEKTRVEITERIEATTEVIETPLDPLVREEQEVETDTISLEQDVEDVQQEREYGQVESADPDANILPHARGVRTEADEQLIYSRYSSAAQIRLGSDGGSITGQLAPLASNPAVPPTLINGTLRFEPWAADNQAGLSATVGVTQFLHPTHRDAVDMYGNLLTPAGSEGPRLLQPTGLIHNTRLVGYVPEVPDQIVPGVKLHSENGVFDLPEDTAVVISPPNPDQVGQGNAAYTHNVGGLIIEDYNGELEFVPQWNYQGYAADSIFLAAGQARRVIYALVPQQDGQTLQLGQRYALDSTENGYWVAESDLNRIKAAPDRPEADYAIAAGGFQVISADQHPENFQQENIEVYAVEDTLDGQNAITASFNGVRGLYRNYPEAAPEPTVDVTQSEGVDARVGNTVSTPDTLIPGTPPQPGYTTTTLAGGLYARGGLSVGLGNQEDVITTNTLTFESQADVEVSQVTTRLFSTPRLQIDTITTQRRFQTTENFLQRGIARFDINAEGLLTNIDTQLQPEQSVSRVEELVDERTSTTTEIQHGAEALIGTTTATLQSDAVFGEFTLADQQVDITTESYPNFSPVVGELALGGILNFGNTPWTPAANTVRAELFVRGTVLGHRDGGTDTGWRTELVFNPFGEEQRPAFYYDQDGTATPLYETEPVLDDAGQPILAPITDVHGQIIEVATNQFLRDEAGELIQATVGTGVSRGPGLYLRLEDLFNDNESLSVIGGIKFDL